MQRRNKQGSGKRGKERWSGVGVGNGGEARGNGLGRRGTGFLALNFDFKNLE
jgi:hypothetical protein